MQKFPLFFSWFKPYSTWLYSKGSDKWWLYFSFQLQISWLLTKRIMLTATRKYAMNDSHFQLQKQLYNHKCVFICLYIIIMLHPSSLSYEISILVQRLQYCGEGRMRLCMMDIYTTYFVSKLAKLRLNT